MKPFRSGTEEVEIALVKETALALYLRTTGILCPRPWAEAVRELK